jgi:holo-[acyl-carrier protein] synthase
MPARNLVSLVVGTDLVEVSRIATVIARHGDRFLERVFTADELAACENRPASLAARWAAKEAVAKALGTGIGAMAFREIEVVLDDCRCPSLRLHGAAANLAAERGLTQWAISLAHDGGLALAFVVGM